MYTFESKHTHTCVYKSKGQTHTHDVHQLKVNIHKCINLKTNTDIYKSKSKHTHDVH